MGTTKKHFVKAAEIVCNHPVEHRLAIIDSFADLFLWDNERFDYRRFIEACGMEFGEHGELVLKKNPDQES